MDWVAFAAALSVGFFSFLRLQSDALNHKFNAVSAEQAYFEDMKKWAEQVCDAMTEALHLCDLDPSKVTGESFFDRRHRLLITLSSLADRGRWFFPNVTLDAHGSDKEPAFRGYRQEVLNGIISGYRFLEIMDYIRPENNRTMVRDGLVQAKRVFVSSVQIALNPARRTAEFDELLLTAKKKRPSIWSWRRRGLSGTWQKG